MSLRYSVILHGTRCNIRSVTQRDSEVAQRYTEENFTEENLFYLRDRFW